MADEITFETCAAQALRLVTELNNRGVYATVKMDDTHLHLHIPAYDKREALDRSIRLDCHFSECEEFLGPLRETVGYFAEAQKRENRVLTFLEGIPLEDLKMLAEEPELHSLMQIAVIRRTAHVQI